MQDVANTIGCCICGDILQEPFNTLGQRVYCAKHFALVNKPHRGLWRAGLAQLIGLVAFAIGVAVLGLVTGPLTAPIVWLPELPLHWFRAYFG